jgi:hypothetical protein
MPQSGKAPGEPADDFRDAIAEWRLGLRTEVKKTSSLPSAMFDACDPMLETRLAESAQAMLAKLQPLAPSADTVDTALVAKRLEKVTPDDMRRLPQRIAEMQVAPVDLESGLLPEYLGILADTCCHATGLAQLGAARLLERDFGLSPSTDLDTLTEMLARQVRESPELFAKAACYRDEDLALACQRVAAALVVHLAIGNGGGA